MVSAVPLATMYFSVFEHRPMLVGVTPAPQTVSPNFPPPSATMIVPASFEAAPPAPVDPPNPVPPAPELVVVPVGFPPDVAPPPAPLVPGPDDPLLAPTPVVPVPPVDRPPPDSPVSEHAAAIAMTAG